MKESPKSVIEDPPESPVKELPVEEPPVEIVKEKPQTQPQVVVPPEP